MKKTQLRGQLLLDYGSSKVARWDTLGYGIYILVEIVPLPHRSLRSWDTTGLA
ncbi:MAG: hypothetical protein M3232_02480 [Thermoproteota archaeon]|jgi:hypothetical protein|nr:hypothetical protein [Thermoproteota archaeon]